MAASMLCMIAFPSVAQEAPTVMSLNVCTDQLVLALAEPEQIDSLSFLSDDPDLSFNHEAAEDFPKNHGLAEEVFLARPEIVVTGAFSLHNTTQLLKHLGIRVEEFDYAQTLATIPGEIRRMGAILGQEERADALANAYEADLARLTAPPGEYRPSIVLYGQNGVVMGAGTLADSVLEAAGFRNLAAERGVAGMAPYPLELLVADDPDVILVNEPVADAPALADQIARHPAIDALDTARSAAIVPRASLGCGGPFVIGALRALRGLRDEIVARRDGTS